jgi:hypothetical protein
MKRLLLFLVFLCFGALNVFAQQKSLPVVQSPSEILQPPRIIVRMPNMTRLTWGRIHYGGFGPSVVFLQSPEIRIVPARVIYILPNAIDTLAGQMLLIKKRSVGFYPRSGKRTFLPDTKPSQALPQPKLEGLWLNGLDALFEPQYRSYTDSDTVQ